MRTLNSARDFLSKAFAGLLVCALATALVFYPANKFLLVPALGAYAAYLWKQPHGWLLVVPALLPVLDFAPWTGWFYLDEFDLLLLATAAMGYWRAWPPGPRARTPRFVLALLALLACSLAVGTWYGLMPLPPLDANAFANYSSRFNALRVAKGFAWAFLLLPLLHRSAGADLSNLQRYFVPGMLLGLAAACLAVVWERWMFPGLSNFASDYRPTATFSAMHTGGAALDAYLAISFPFLAAWLIHGGSRRQLALGLPLLLLACYAGLTTFSRDMYLAYATSAALIATLALVRAARGGKLDRRLLLGTVALLALATLVLSQVFSTSGYRGLAAALVLLLAAVFLAAQQQRLTRDSAWAAPLALLLFGAAMFALGGVQTTGGGVGKATYFGFAVAAAVFAAAAAQLCVGRLHQRAVGMTIATAAFCVLAAGTVLIALHWGGSAAIGDAVLAVVLAGALIVLNRVLERPLWQPTRNTFTFTAFFAIVFATVIPLSGSYYMGSRFASAGDDMAVRLNHWSEAFHMMDDNWHASAFGMGLGRYPDTYYWKNDHGETPGSISYETEGNNMFLRLVSATYSIGYGEALRSLQAVELKTGARYELALDVRRSQPKAELNLAICERWLLYPQNCIAPRLKLAPADGKWHHYTLPIEAGAIGAGTLARTRTMLEMSANAVGPSTVLEIDNLSLRESNTDAELLRNGSFSYGKDYWFFSSDRNHMPWHAKNVVVSTFFELGWLGSIVLALLLLYAAGDLAARALHGEAIAAVYLAALAGMLVVGIFDSLTDVPRLTVVLFLVLLAATLREAKPLQRRRKQFTAPAQQAQADDLMA
jgi:hypothetical protein